MTRYTTKPQTVEAMQWLGPDDPAHVAEFGKWLQDVADFDSFTCLQDYHIRSDETGETFCIPVGHYAVFEAGEGLTAERKMRFHARYTPTPDVEDAP